MQDTKNDTNIDSIKINIKWNIPLYRIIMDESGQVTPQQAWIPLRLLKDSDDVTVSVYGDDVQLTPISPDFVQEKSVLRHLRTNNERCIRMLNTTYRLKSPGVDMTSQLFYDGKTAGSTSQEKKITSW